MSFHCGKIKSHLFDMFFSTFLVFFWNFVLFFFILFSSTMMNIQKMEWNHRKKPTSREVTESKAKQNSMWNETMNVVKNNKINTDNDCVCNIVCECESVMVRAASVASQTKQNRKKMKNQKQNIHDNSPGINHKNVD